MVGAGSAERWQPLSASQMRPHRMLAMRVGVTFVMHRAQSRFAPRAGYDMMWPPTPGEDYMDKTPHEEQVLSASEQELPELVRQKSSQGWSVVALTTDPSDGRITVLLARPIKKEKQALDSNHG